jgi:hypothetical protein
MPFDLRERNSAGFAGESMRVGGMAVMQTLLEESLRIQIYKEVCEWIHPIFQAHVRPTMLLARQSNAADK